MAIIHDPGSLYYYWLFLTFGCYIESMQYHRFFTETTYLQFNLGLFFPSFIMYFLAFLTILSYHIYYPKQVINSIPPAHLFHPSDADLPYIVLKVSFIFLLTFLPHLTYMLSYPFPMVYIGRIILRWAFVYGILTICSEEITIYYKVFIFVCFCYYTITKYLPYLSYLLFQS